MIVRNAAGEFIASSGHGHTILPVEKLPARSFKKHDSRDAPVAIVQESW